jgi:hypothetical protein
MSLQVELVSRQRCHLCDEMKALLERLAQEQAPPLSFRVLDVDREPGLFLYYTHRVPVLLVNGKPVAELRWDEEAVRKQLFPSPSP